jgi:hypothetical protein
MLKEEEDSMTADSALSFKVLSQLKYARASIMNLPHGEVMTPGNVDWIVGYQVHHLCSLHACRNKGIN